MLRLHLGRTPKRRASCERDGATTETGAVRSDRNCEPANLNPGSLPPRSRTSSVELFYSQLNFCLFRQTPPRPFQAPIPTSMRTPTPSRRLLPALSLAVSLLAFAAPEKPGAEVLIGADVSALATIEAHGGHFSDGGKREDALTIFRQNGFSCFRLRLFVSPDGVGIVTNDLPYTLALAKRVKASGAGLLLDLHYSDTWADPQKQFKPAAWEKLPFEQLVAAVERHTQEVLRSLAAQGTAPDYVQIGNEITNGLLWPDGKVEFEKTDDEESWRRFTRLLQAGVDGVRAVFPDKNRPQILLHIESSGNAPRSLWFFRGIERHRVPYDAIGLSYYPDWHGKIADFRATLATLATTFHKPILVVETAYPSRGDKYWNGKPNLDWPISPEGQRAFLSDVLAAVRDTPEGLGAGLFYWFPEAIPVEGLHAWVGGSCALFDVNGNALPALSFAAPRLSSQTPPRHP
ncbi:hypothetical protein DB347_15255 [Opitutaceae bacterium EW11]|nr:hypothetical protein DB347_15255 [Opitutaceae bacterium EW11]